jgi:hypothetical protein
LGLNGVKEAEAMKDRLLFRMLILVGVTPALVWAASPAGADIQHFEVVGASLVDEGIQVEGSIGCEASESFRITIGVSRSTSDLGDLARARGQTFRDCTGDEQQWQVLASVIYGDFPPGAEIEIFYRVKTLQDRVTTDASSDLLTGMILGS